jgi:hypothetical protein
MIVVRPAILGLILALGSSTAAAVPSGRGRETPVLRGPVGVAVHRTSPVALHSLRTNPQPHAQAYAQPHAQPYAAAPRPRRAVPESGAQRPGETRR